MKWVPLLYIGEHRVMAFFFLFGRKSFHWQQESVWTETEIKWQERFSLPACEFWPLKAKCEEGSCDSGDRPVPAELREPSASWDENKTANWSIRDFWPFPETRVQTRSYLTKGSSCSEQQRHILQSEVGMGSKIPWGLFPALPAPCITADQQSLNVFWLFILPRVLKYFNAGLHRGHVPTIHYVEYKKTTCFAIVRLNTDWIAPCLGFPLTLRECSSFLSRALRSRMEKRCKHKCHTSNERKRQV